MDDLTKLYDRIFRDWERRLDGGQWVKCADLQRAIPEPWCETYLRFFPQDSPDRIGHARRRIFAEVKKRFEEDGYEFWRHYPYTVRKLLDLDASCTLEELLVDWREPACVCCLAAWGELHQTGCTCELCPYCGQRAWSCRCAAQREFGGLRDDDRMPFDGFSLATRWACEFRWFEYGYSEEEDADLRCGPYEHDNAYPDFMRPLEEAVWDREKKRFVLPEHDAVESRIQYGSRD